MADLRFRRLLDRYSPLLTDIQREITDLYYNYDLSLAEIAEEKGCSRQSVSDCLAKCRKKIEWYEEKLHAEESIAGAMEALEGFGKKYPEHEAEIEKIVRLLKNGNQGE
ncbi:MAG: DNA-binding protein [Clostridia bacterium]|nr:DNA-binding protein [Clostridia bacterium]